MKVLMLVALVATASARPDIGISQGYRYPVPATSYGVPAGSVGNLNSGSQTREYYHVQNQGANVAPTLPTTDFQTPIHEHSAFGDVRAGFNTQGSGGQVSSGAFGGAASLSGNLFQPTNNFDSSALNRGASSFGVSGTSAPTFAFPTQSSASFGLSASSAPTFGISSNEGSSSFGLSGSSAPTFGISSGEGSSFGVSGSSPTFGLSSSSFDSSLNQGSFGVSSTPSPLFGSSFGVSSTPSPVFGSSFGVSSTPSPLFGSSFGVSSTPSPSFGSSSFGSNFNTGSFGSQNSGVSFETKSNVNGQAEVSKHLYFYAAPEEPEQVQTRVNIPVAPPKKNVKIIFIKAPAYAAAPVQIPILPQNEEKTLVYVLVKKPEEQSAINIPAAPATPPTKPEVYFIKYKTQQEAEEAISKVQGGATHGGASISANSVEGDQAFINTIGQDIHHVGGGVNYVSGQNLNQRNSFETGNTFTNQGSSSGVASAGSADSGSFIGASGSNSGSFISSSDASSGSNTGSLIGSSEASSGSNSGSFIESSEASSGSNSASFIGSSDASSASNSGSFIGSSDASSGSNSDSFIDASSGSNSGSFISSSDASSGSSSGSFSVNLGTGSQEGASTQESGSFQVSEGSTTPSSLDGLSFSTSNPVVGFHATYGPPKF